MRTIINRKIYDTETAAFVGHHGDDERTEDLYRTNKGVFFIHGQGVFYPPKSDFTVKGEGEDLTPMTAEEAFEWIMEFGLVADALYELVQLFPRELEEA